MNIKVKDLMSSQVLTAQRHQTVGHVRQVMSNNGIHAMPVVGSDGDVIGMVTSTDLVGTVKEDSRISAIMSTDVVTVPAYSEPRTAARCMRNQHFHHLVVLDEKKVVGILSTFDLLRLVEDKRFVMKSAAPQGKNSNRFGLDDE